jgi:excisionase family DNA binding protein
MEDIVLSSISISDLVEKIAVEVHARFNNQRLEQTPATIDDKRFSGDQALADYLHCTIQTINKLKKSGKLPFHKFGRKYYYIQSEIDAAFKGRK